MRSKSDSMLKLGDNDEEDEVELLANVYEEKLEEMYLAKILITDEEVKYKKGKIKSFITTKHLKTKRNYLQRMNDEKIIAMKKSKIVDLNSFLSTHL